jgi:predicted phosphodiesterase
MAVSPTAYGIEPEARDPQPTFAPKEKVTLLFLGDTGEPGPEIEAIRRAVSQEKKDAIVVFAYSAGEPDLILPDLSYDVDFGVLKLSVINTNALDLMQARDISASWENYDGWRVIAGHHVYRTYHDKAHEDIVAPWLKMNHLVPDIYLNGHAHILQFGIYDGIPALTSGATAKARERPTCPPDCGKGQRFGASKPGYALVTFERSSMTVIFKDTKRRELFRWSKKREKKHTNKSGR